MHILKHPFIFLTTQWKPNVQISWFLLYFFLSSGDRKLPKSLHFWILICNFSFWPKFTSEKHWCERGDEMMQDATY
jgi:hypothetical protein